MSESTVLPIASIQKRITAFVIDDMIVAVLILIIFYEQLVQIASQLPTVLIPEAVLYLGFVFAFFLPLKQTFHDKLSGCVVVDA